MDTAPSPSSAQSPDSPPAIQPAAIDVLCIGHACFDLILPVPEFPAENSKMEVGTLLESGGGPAANAAWMLSRWGVPTAFAGLVGDDVWGRRVADEFRAAGTDSLLLEIRPGGVTPLSLVIVNGANGSRTIINRKPAGAALNPAMLTRAAISPRILLFDGHEADASMEAIARFPTACTVLDAGSLRDGTSRLAGRVDCLAASERFARSLTGLSELDSDASRIRCLARLRAENPHGIIIVTLGERGLIYERDGQPMHMPAYPVTAIDTTAAGDLFHGALVYGLLKAMPLPEALQLASYTAARSVQVRGGRSSTPERTDVLAGLRNAPVESRILRG